MNGTRSVFSTTLNEAEVKTFCTPWGKLFYSIRFRTQVEDYILDCNAKDLYGLCFILFSRCDLICEIFIHRWESFDCIIFGLIANA